MLNIIIILFHSAINSLFSLEFSLNYIVVVLVHVHVVLVEIVK